MVYRKLGKSQLEVSAIGLGTWVFGGDHWGKIDKNLAIQAIHQAIDLGVNLIDTAPAYGIGQAEELVGKAIRGKRDQVILATKCGVHRQGQDFSITLKPGEIRKELEASLKRLQVEAIDLYQCHWPDPDTPLEDTLREMKKMQQQGKIRFIGVSNFDLPLLEEAIKSPEVVSIQPHYSVLERRFEKTLLPFCRKSKIGVLSYGTLAGGVLSGKYQARPEFPETDARAFFYKYYREPYWSQIQPLLTVLRQIAGRHDCPMAQVAINWALSQPGISSVLVGCRTGDQVRLNLGAADWSLSGDESKEIESAYQNSLDAK